MVAKLFFFYKYLFYYIYNVYIYTHIINSVNKALYDKNLYYVHNKKILRSNLMILIF